MLFSRETLLNASFPPTFLRFLGKTVRVHFFIRGRVHCDLTVLLLELAPENIDATGTAKRVNTK